MKNPIAMKEIVRFMDETAPRERAEAWDHVGLMVGSEETEVRGIVLSLDVTSEAIELCEESGANLMITHHPLFFTPCFSIETDTPQGSLIARLLRGNISVFSAHTNLDRADFSVNHALAQKLGLNTVGTLEDCAFGLLCRSEKPLHYLSFSSRVRDALKSSGVFLNSARDGDVQNFCLCAGSFDEALIPAVLRASVDAVITGEMKHHLMVLMNESGVRVIAAGHEASERVILKYLEILLREKFPSLPIRVAEGNIF
ncbi:MAG: Nif3-like dinuclear metal center hexameric protein [Oscillospiraceae bacterium]|nr:Nif3-like dinuclear metal center hexameric protein [Oscillospiraceae bacterium]